MKTKDKPGVLGYRPGKDTLKRVEAFIAKANELPLGSSTRLDKSAFLAKAVEAVLNGEREVHFVFFRTLGEADLAKCLKWLGTIERRLIDLTAEIKQIRKLSGDEGALDRIERSYSKELALTQRFLEALRSRTGLAGMLTNAVCDEIKKKHYAHLAFTPLIERKVPATARALESSEAGA